VYDPAFKGHRLQKRGAGCGRLFSFEHGVEALAVYFCSADQVQAELTAPLERTLEAALLLGVTALAALVWELAEFTSDALGWTTAQKGLEDTLLDLTMGVVGAALWMAPYLFFDSLRPDDAGFDANQWGESLAPIVLAIRCIGYGVVTPE
jgi:hypothetical protein